MSLQSFSRTNGRPGRKYNIESHYLSVAANIFESSSRQLTSSYSRTIETRMELSELYCLQSRVSQSISPHRKIASSSYLPLFACPSILVWPQYNKIYLGCLLASYSSIIETRMELSELHCLQIRVSESVSPHRTSSSSYRFACPSILVWPQ
jgi:hypothetical protein